MRFSLRGTSFFFYQQEEAVAVIEAGFVGRPHIKISSFFSSICSHVTGERSYFPAGIQQTCVRRENFSRVENLLFFCWGFFGLIW